MTPMENFDKATTQRRRLKAWWAMKDLLAAYDKSNYVLRIDFSKPSMVAFCGQQFAGDRNYHDAPEFFRDEIVSVLNSMSYDIAQKAYNSAILKLDKEIASLKAYVTSEIAKSEEPT